MKFYVTMVRGKRVAWLAGPFDTKGAAELIVPAAREAAVKVNPHHHFDAFGVASLTLAPGQTYYRPGILNKQLGLHTGLVREGPEPEQCGDCGGVMDDGWCLNYGCCGIGGATPDGHEMAYQARVAAFRARKTEGA